MTADNDILLALDTSSRVGRVALARGDALLASRDITAGMRHGRDLLPTIDALLRDAALGPHDLAAVAVSIGPGSFTGLRISVVFARMLAWQRGVKVVAVPTLQAIAENAPPDALRVAVLTDAQRGGIYWAAYARAASGDALEGADAESVDPPETVAARLPEGATLIGDGLRRYGETFAAWPQTDESLWAPRAEAVARLGAEMHRRGRHTPAEMLEPLYVRRPAPEEQLERRRRGGR